MAAGHMMAHAYSVWKIALATIGEPLPAAHAAAATGALSKDHVGHALLVGALTQTQP